MRRPLIFRCRVKYSLFKMEKLKKLISAKNNYSEAVTRRCYVRNFANFTRKHLCQSLFFNKVADLSPATLLKTRLWHRCFCSEFCEISKKTFSTNTSWRLLLITFIQILGRSKIYVNESVNRQSGLVLYLPTTIIFSLNHELKQIILPGTPRNLKKTFCISKKCNKGDITG